MTYNASKNQQANSKIHLMVSYRFPILIFVFGMLVTCLLIRLIYLHTVADDFLRKQGAARQIRIVDIPAVRGAIIDRNGEPLAISAPVNDIIADPYILNQNLGHANFNQLAELLNINVTKLSDDIGRNSKRRFMYLERQITPVLASKIERLKVPGINRKTNYKRYYPAAEVSGHILGFTDLDDQGQEGLELIYNDLLAGKNGKKKVLKDLKGRIIKELNYLVVAEPGKDLVTSLDKRIQYMTYRYLKSAVQKHQAQAGSAVVIRNKTGEILAMVNQPAFNPNNLRERQAKAYRNRAVTDLFEPGSTVKPFTILAGLNSGKFDLNSRFDVNPGVMKIGKYSIRDTKNYNSLSLTEVITKSSNIAAAQIALALDPEAVWDTFYAVGFSQDSGLYFPGESAGRMVNHIRWSKIERASFAYGYGLSVTSLQLAQAYSVLANLGVQKQLTITKVEQPVAGVRVFPKKNIRKVLDMMGTVVEKGGTATLAKLPYYYVGGKTGTIRAVEKGKYTQDQYHAVFVGIAPLTDPELVVVVVINRPQGEHYYGGAVAAPVFAKVLAGSLRLLNIPPDNVKQQVWRAING